MPVLRMPVGKEQDESFEGVNLAELARKITPHVKAWSGKYGLLILILIPLLLSILIRLQPIGYPGIEDHARAQVYAAVKSQIAAQIRQAYPGVPDRYLQDEVNKRFRELLKQPGVKEQLERQAEQLAQQEKAYFQFPNGAQYMPDIDPYFWLYYAENILNHGYPGDMIKDGKQWDARQLAPYGREVTPDRWHAYFLAYWYKLVKLFKPSIDPMHAAMLYPVAVMALATLLIFFLARAATNAYGGFFAAMLFAMNPGLLGRTLYGRADTDAWVITFPLLVFTFAVLSIRSRKTWQKHLYATLAGITTGVFSYAWGGWWYAADIVLAAYALTLLTDWLARFILTSDRKHSILSFTLTLLKQSRGLISTIIAYFTSMGLTAWLIRGTPWAVFSFLGALHFNQLKAPVRLDIWPNVLTTVAELNPAQNVMQVITSVGGTFIFTLSLLGILLGLIHAFRKRDETSLFTSILTLVWMSATFYASLKGIRFTLLLAPAVTLGFGMVFAILFQKIEENLKAWRKDLAQPLTQLIAILIAVLLLMPPTLATNPDGSKSLHAGGIYKQSLIIARNDLPLVDDTWWTVLTTIKNETSPDAIITSWWDFGHHFKYIAKRRVTFDGTTQEQTPAHWVGRLFLTRDEKESVGILRMLDCSGNEGFKRVNTIIRDELKTISLLHELVRMNRSEAESYLQAQGFTPEEITTILNQTHCQPPEGIVIASGDMIGKAGVWAHFGSWNFTRAYAYQRIINPLQPEEAYPQLARLFNTSLADAVTTYHRVKSMNYQEANTWIASWPSYYGTANCQTDNRTGMISCSFTYARLPILVTINTTTMHPILQIGGTTYNHGIVLGYQNGTAYEIVDTGTANLTVQGQTIPLRIGVSLLEPGRAMISDPALVGSMFSRLYFYDGYGLSCYEPFLLTPWPRQGKINVYTAVWDCSRMEDRPPISADIQYWLNVTGST